MDHGLYGLKSSLSRAIFEGDIFSLDFPEFDVVVSGGGKMFVSKPSYRVNLIKSLYL